MNAGSRPAVSVIVPFAGSPADADQMLESLLHIDLEPDDEIIVVDNTGHQIVPNREGVRVVEASRESSAYYARNEGSETARNPWLLFTDADCKPSPDLLDRYFDAQPADDVGAVIGEVVGDPQQSSLVSRYARSRGHLSQELHWNSPFRPWGVTANLLVRRAAWESVGGFHEGIRSGGDTEFSWRLQDAGWRLEFRPQALVEHSHRETIVRLARQAGRYGAGRAWVMRRYPSSFERPSLTRRLGRCAAGVFAWTLLLQFERAMFKALDAIYVVSEWTSFWLLSNTPPRPGAARGSQSAVVVDEFPAAGAVGELQSADSNPAFVVALHRPVRIDRDLSRRVAIGYLEDDGGLRRLRGTFELLRIAPASVLRHPKAAFELSAAACELRHAGVRSITALDGEASRRRALVLAELLGLPHP